MDEERRRHERRARAGEAPEALLREALARRRSGELEDARDALARLVELEPGHGVARALLLITELALGRGGHGSFHEASRHAVDLVSFLDPASFAAVARSALDPSHGAVDAAAIDALVESGEAGTLVVLEALVEFECPPERARVVLGLRARAIARAGLTPESVSPSVKRRVIEGLDEPHGADWILLAGALHLKELRPRLEALLDAAEAPRRHAAAVALELLGDPAARRPLERALSHARQRGERVVLERALERLGR